MSTFTDYAKAILAGGLPNILDYGNNAAQAAQGNARPETLSPAGTRVDVEPARLNANVSTFNWKQAALIGGGILGGVAVLWVGLRVAKSRG